MPRRGPYDDIDARDLTTRDRLALSRSRLANERTLLAYVRTGVSLVGLGAIVAKWFGHMTAIVAGIGLALAGAAILLAGGLRFATENRRYRSLQKDVHDHDGS